MDEKKLLTDEEAEKATGGIGPTITYECTKCHKVYVTNSTSGSIIGKPCDNINCSGVFRVKPSVDRL